MFGCIVVPVDGSAASEHILPHVAELRRAVDAGVTLLHVAAPDLKAQVRGREYLEGLKRRVAGLLGSVRTELRKGEPAFEILKHAVAERAGLVALTTRGGSPFRRVLYGSTAIDLLRSSRVPLFIARPEWEARPLRRILAGFDASRLARAALPLVAGLARGAGAEVVLARVLPEAGSDPALDRAAGVLSRGGVRIATLVKSGDPARGIIEAARETGADMIALGTHGRRGTDRFFFGSVAESVLLHAPVPVLLRRSVRVPRFGALGRGMRA